jgi:hypothetical protein
MNDARRRRTLTLAASAGVIGAIVLFAGRHGHPDPHGAALDEPSVTASPDEDRAPAPQPAASTVASATSVAASAETTAPAPAASGFDETELMRLLRSARGNDPGLAVELAREGNRRFPTSPDAPERASILVHALTDQGHASEARGEAEDMVNRYPDSSWVHEIERFTGAHRHRNVRVDDQGRLVFYDPPS